MRKQSLWLSLLITCQTAYVMKYWKLVEGGNTPGTTNMIPRSRSSRYRTYINNKYCNEENDDRSGESFVSGHVYPPWNPSKHIDNDGFLTSLYPLMPGEWEEEVRLTGKHSGRFARRRLSKQFVKIRQVPGDGNCLFHSLSACLSLQVNGTHADMYNTTLLCIQSSCLRNMAVDCLSGEDYRNDKSKRKKLSRLDRRDRLLFLQGNEYLRASDLVKAAASQYNITSNEYCKLMRRDAYWGGGPEIVALCNVLKRPIHVYELTADNKSSNESNLPSPGFRLRRMACFGSPKFDRKEPLLILSADSRFPDVVPGKHLASGNHFLALFPMQDAATHTGERHENQAESGKLSNKHLNGCNKENQKNSALNIFSHLF